MSEGERIALRQVLRHTSRDADVLIEVVALRRPEVVARFTRYAGVVVDERFLTRGFPWVPRPDYLQVVVLLSGKARFGAEGARPALAMAPGDAVLLAPAMMSRMRFEDATYLDLEWKADRVDEASLPRRIVPVDIDEAARVAQLLADPSASERATYAQAFALFAAAGAPLAGLDASSLQGGPDERDVRLAAGLSAQLRELATAASSVHLGDLAKLSPRQLQRVVSDFSARYGVNAKTWRDTRNRYRVQIAAALLSVPRLSVAAIAKEVGYGSAAALARAFANVGFPPPNEARQELARLATVE